MDKMRLQKLEKALEAYTKEVTKPSQAAREDLTREGIYHEDGELAPEYKAPSAA